MADVAFANAITLTGIEPLHLFPDLGLDAGNLIAFSPDRSFWVSQGREVLIAFNTTGGSLNLTFVTVAKADGRVQSTAQSVFAVPAGKYRIFGDFPLNGWADPTSNQIIVQASATGLRGVVLRLPR